MRWTGGNQPLSTSAIRADGSKHQERTVWSICLFSHRRQFCDLLIAAASAEQRFRVSAVDVEGIYLAFLLGDVLLHFVE
jgi:hypothetical protein